MSDDLILGRKDQHLDVVLSGGGRHALASGFDDWRFVHEALPDLDHAKIDLGADFLGRRLQAPLLISAMTGGLPGPRPSTPVWPRRPSIWASPWPSARNAPRSRAGRPAGWIARCATGRPTRPSWPISARLS